MKYYISARRYLLFNIKIITILSILHLLTRIFINIFEIKYLTFANIFLIDVERNIPTLYSGITLIFSSILLYFIGFNEIKKMRKINFFFMSLFFLFLATDEIFMIHEYFGRLIRTIFIPNSFFYFAWVIPYGVLGILLSIYFYLFMSSLPKSIFKFILISGILYLGGELILEMIGSFIYTNNNKEISFTYLFISSIEEIMAMSGIVLFNFSLLKLLSSTKLNIDFRK